MEGRNEWISVNDLYPDNELTSYPVCIDIGEGAVFVDTFATIKAANGGQ